MFKIDLHVDTPLKMYKYGVDILQETNCRVDIPKIIRGGLSAAFFAIFIPQGSRDLDGYKEARKRAHNTLDIVWKNFRDKEELDKEVVFFDNNYGGYYQEKGFLLAKDFFNVYPFFERNPNLHCILLGLENGYAIEKSSYYMEEIKTLYLRGIRYITLCHKYNNDICDSSTDIEEHGGLSEFGRLVVEECNKIGIMVDVSHASNKTIEQVIELSEKPIIASHSCCYYINPHPRNLNDELIKKIAKNNGTVGVCLYNTLVSNKKIVYVSDVVDHIQHIAELVGTDYISIGSDFDGEPFGNVGIKDCKNIEEISNIDIELRKRGFLEEDIEKIWGKNFIRVFEKH